MCVFVCVRVGKHSDSEALITADSLGKDNYTNRENNGVHFFKKKNNLTQITNISIIVTLHLKPILQKSSYDLCSLLHTGFIIPNLNVTPNKTAF